MRVIFWDYDGVIMDSMPIRDQGFVEVLKGFPTDQVEELLKFHKENGGLSRYVKFRYFFETIRGEPLSDENLHELCGQFSQIMRQLLLNPKLLIKDSVDFIKQNHKRFDMHIVSGSDGKELRFLCQSLGLSQYFLSVNGSPTPKKQLVNDILKDHQYSAEDCLLIGDSKNDFEAAEVNNMKFYGFNNPALKTLDEYIESFKSFNI